MIYTVLAEYMWLASLCLLTASVTWFLVSPDAARHRWIGGLFLGVLVMSIIFVPILTYP